MYVYSNSNKRKKKAHLAENKKNNKQQGPLSFLFVEKGNRYMLTIDKEVCSSKIVMNVASEYFFLKKC
jgi:hypothetical protein